MNTQASIGARGTGKDEQGETQADRNRRTRYLAKLEQENEKAAQVKRVKNRVNITRKIGNAISITDDAMISRISGKVQSTQGRLYGPEKVKAGDKTILEHPMELSFHERDARGEIGHAVKHTSKRIVRIVGNESEAAESPDYKARQRALDASHPLAALASFVAHRLLNPGLSKRQNNATPIAGRGSNKSKRKIKGYAEKVTFAGHEARTMHATDRAELLGAISVAILSKPCDPRALVHALGIAYRSEVCPIANSAHAPGGSVPFLEPAMHAPCIPCRIVVGCHKFGFGEWRQIFTAARATLGIKRGTARGAFQIDTMDSEASAIEIARASLVATIEKERDDQAKEDRQNMRDDLAIATRAMRRKIARSLHAEKASGARKWKFNFQQQTRHLLASVRATLGNGHGHAKGRTAAYERADTFREYIAIGARAEVSNSPLSRAFVSTH